LFLRLQWEQISFSDWRTPLYIYSISIVNIFIQNPELSVRLPSVIFGSLSSVIFYLLLKKIKFKLIPALISTIVWTLNPWLFHFSRTGFEVSGMILFFLLAIYSLISYLTTKKTSYLYPMVIFFGLMPLFYSTSKLSLILIAVTIIYIWFHTIIKLPKKTIILLACLTLFISSPLIIDTVRSRSGFRFSYINIFTEPHLDKKTDYLRYEDIYSDHIGEIGVVTPLSSKIIHNRYTLMLNKFIQNYISSFSTDFLFLKGDLNLRHGFSNYGYFYLIDLVIFLIGMYSFLKTKNILKKQISKFFLISLLLAPIPFALTRDSLSPHATRLILMAPSIIYFISLGINYLYQKIKTTPLKILLSFGLFITYIISFLYFFHFYRYHYPQTSARDWHYGIKQTLSQVSKTNYKNFYISNKYESFLPFYLFYQNYVPIKQDCSPVKSIISQTSDYFTGLVTESNYHFGIIEWSSILNQSQILATSAFIIPQSELSTVENALSDKFSMKIINQSSQKYLNQENFIFFTIE